MMLTVFEDYERIYESITAGATGYLLKMTAPEKLLEAIRELHGGGAPMSGQIARKVLAAFRSVPHFKAGAAKLTPVETAVLQRLARGLLYKEVADEMGIAPGTVRTHINHIHHKLHSHNRTEAVLKGLEPYAGK
jgi:DNA-binding NarL/FixJ family response regulator